MPSLDYGRRGKLQGKAKGEVLVPKMWGIYGGWLPGDTPSYPAWTRKGPPLGRLPSDTSSVQGFLTKDGGISGVTNQGLKGGGDK